MNFLENVCPYIFLEFFEAPKWDVVDYKYPRRKANNQNLLQVCLCHKLTLYGILLATVGFVLRRQSLDDEIFEKAKKSGLFRDGMEQ